MQFDKNSLPETKDGLIEYIERLIHKVNDAEQASLSIKSENKSLKIEILILTERLAARNRRLFGRSSEKLSADVYAGWLFNELETIAPKRTAENRYPRACRAKTSSTI